MTKRQLEEALAGMKQAHDQVLLQLGAMNQAIGTCEERLAQGDYQEEPEPPPSEEGPASPEA